MERTARDDLILLNIKQENHMRTFYSFLLAIVLMLLTANVHAQESFSTAIEDNSFFIEEAYNQETGIVQHISNAFYFSKPSRDFSYSFTQEWPVGSQTHQLSYTIPYLSIASGSAAGLSDIYLNYRYQLISPEDHVFALSPRVSLILATGNQDKGLGNGVLGYQFNLPFSQRIAEQWVYHLNAGFTLLPSVKASLPTGDVKKSLLSYSAGGSLIWLATEKFNLMLETLVNNSAEIGNTGTIERATETIVNPGFRFAIDIGSLQIVPGVSLPISFANSLTRVGALGYVSFEHPL